MPKTMIPAKVVEDAVHLACRAPSYHNTQPWRWVVEGGELHLFVDADRVVATDHGGRQALISCGAVLDHLRVAMAAAGHQAHVDYYPNPNDHKHVASIGFSPHELRDRGSPPPGRCHPAPAHRPPAVRPAPGLGRLRARRCAQPSTATSPPST